MRHRTSPNSHLAWILIINLLGASLSELPGTAHTVKAVEDVAVTFHLEPNHNPKAGEPAQAWFVLTQPGGKVIPLDQCDCKLVVYDQQHPQGAAPLLQPPLQTVSAEQFQGIPGAEIVFPKPGVYQLELQGAPKTALKFQPFQISFPVTVATGRAKLNAPDSLQASTKEQGWQSVQTGVIAGGAIAVILGLSLVGLILQRTKGSNP